MTVSEKLHQSAFAIIYAPILYNPELTDSEKIVYGHISNLSNECGYCYATNGYLADLSGKSILTIKRAIKKLKDLHFIQIKHVLHGKHDERRITLSHFPHAKTEKEEGSSKMSHPQLKNELPGGSEMSHRIIKEERINKKTTTQELPSNSKAAKRSPESSSFFKCKNKLEKLEKLAIPESQKQKIYCNFEEERILQGLEWLESAGARENISAALYDALKHGYKPKLNKEELALQNKKYAHEKLHKFDDRTVNGYRISLCRQYVEFSSPTGATKYFDYCYLNFKREVKAFCLKLGIEFS